MTGYVAQPNGNEDALVQAIANKGPVSVAFYVTSNIQNYRGGIFTDSSCPAGQINHATLVGYGHDNLSNLDYYIMRNSWGTGVGKYFAYIILTNN